MRGSNLRSPLPHGHPRRFRLLFLRRLGCGALDRLVEPRNKTGRCAIAGLADEQETFERLPGEIHLAGMRFLEERVVAIREHANHEAVLVDPTAHVAVEHEAQPTEHALLFDALSAREVAPDSFRQSFVVGHLKLRPALTLRRH